MGSGITSNILQSKRSSEVDCQLWNSAETSKTEKICPENYCSREIWWLSPWSWIWCGCCGTCLCYWVHKWRAQCLPSWSISHFPRQHFLFCHWLGSFGEWWWVSLVSLCPVTHVPDKTDVSFLVFLFVLSSLDLVFNRCMSQWDTFGLSLLLFFLAWSVDWKWWEDPEG